MNTLPAKRSIKYAEQELDFLRACSEAGGKHQYAFELCIDEQELEKAYDIIAAEAERIKRELEREQI